MNRGHTIRMLTVLSALTFLLSGCSRINTVVNYEVNSEDVTSITFFGNKYEPENVTVIEEIITAFTIENPGIRVSYESLKGTDYYEALEKRMAAGRGDDVFMVNHDIVLKLQGEGRLADLSGLSTISDFTDKMRAQMDSDGRIYWVPTTVSVFGLYCNLDLLKKHRQSIPETLAEWESVCDYFVGRGITPIIANNDISLKTLAIGKGFYSLYQEGRQADAFSRINSGGESLSDYLTSGFSLVKEFIDRGYVDAEEALVTKKTSDDLALFCEGNTPFMLTGAWAAGRVKGMDPGFAFAVAPYPILEDGSLVVVNADTRLSVNAASDDLDAAYRFVEYFTQTENIQKFADQQTSISPLKSGNLYFISEIQPLIPCYQSGEAVIGTDELLDLPIWDITAQAARMLLRGESLEAAMAWMDQQDKGEG